MTAAVGKTQPASVADDLEMPRPLRLLLTMGWSLSESVGLPVAAEMRALGHDVQARITGSPALTELLG